MFFDYFHAVSRVFISVMGLELDSFGACCRQADMVAKGHKV